MFILLSAYYVLGEGEKLAYVLWSFRVSFLYNRERQYSSRGRFGQFFENIR